MTARLLCLLLSLNLLGPRAFAALGGGAGLGTKQSQTQSPDNGLCMNTAVNKSSPQIRDGLCQEMLKQMDKEPCMKDLVEKLFKLANAGQLQGMEEWCPSAGQLTSNVDNFKQFVINLQASVAWAESRCESIPGKSINPATGKRPMGVCQIGVDSVQPYCGCKGKINDSTILDGKANITCGLGISLTNMVKDKQVGTGQGGDKTSYGVAKYNSVGRTSDAARTETVSRVAHYCKVASNSPQYYSPFNEGGGGGSQGSGSGSSAAAF